MFKSGLTLFTAVASMLAVSGFAHADISKPIGIQIGIETQTNDSTRKIVNDSGLHVGAEFDFSTTNTLFVLPGTQGFDVDWNHSSGHGTRLDSYGVLYTNRIYLLPRVVQGVTADMVPYIGFGVGAFQNDIRLRTATSTSVSHITKTETSLGGKVLAGISTNSGVFLEAGFTIAGSVHDINTDVADISIGSKF